ncbi:response regulator receiver domain-containing protein [Hoeflea marina]|uniref:Response regulator receiver domain-containing protein n=1 Tax=Hoeflea marina TaxID=274592 RepID=A0A317PPF4_9HYPH|nr:response regulator [Hoeflea marina]PWW02161.1 response regulator receiver domain-containing protein [Hoeflea marina]
MAIGKILIVDDDENDQFICEYTIRKFDPSIVIHKAYDGTEALALLRVSMPNAIILDINMPVMNGFEFLDHYATEFINHAPVVAMLTSSHLDKDRERALRYDFVKSYFEKPLTLDHLQVMKDLLDDVR